MQERVGRAEKGEGRCWRVEERRTKERPPESRKEKKMATKRERS